MYYTSRYRWSSDEVYYGRDQLDEVYYTHAFTKSIAHGSLLAGGSYSACWRSHLASMTALTFAAASDRGVKFHIANRDTCSSRSHFIIAETSTERAVPFRYGSYGLVPPSCWVPLRALVVFGGRWWQAAASPSCFRWLGSGHQCIKSFGRGPQARVFSSPLPRPNRSRKSTRPISVRSPGAHVPTRSGLGYPSKHSRRANGDAPGL